MRYLGAGLVLGAAVLAGLPAMAAEISVDVGAPFKPVDHAASGSLYGIAAEGWPADKWIAAIHPKNFTQMAPDGAQLPNLVSKANTASDVWADTAYRSKDSLTRSADT